MQARDEFSSNVKRTIAERAGYRCSRPECRRPTIGPHSDTAKSTSTGVAAHIRAAAQGGPRFDPNQTEEDRKSIDNAIWLCHSCSDLVDKDEGKFPADQLKTWKLEQERWIARDEGAPLLPDITLRTHKGLTLPNRGPVQIRSEDVVKFREHILVINNTTKRVIRYLACRIQFPEPIVHREVAEKPAGVSVECNPDRMEMVAHASGGGSVNITGPLRTALDYKLSLDKLPVNGQVKIRFLSQADENGLSAPSGFVSLEHHIVGEFQYTLLEEDQTRKFLVPLRFNRDERLITSEPCEDDDGARKILIRMSWP